jgi:hypothetical protein
MKQQQKKKKKQSMGKMPMLRTAGTAVVHMGETPMLQ